ncbi:GNAT family N-acetyltransferase [Zoogloea sp.]|uniref:GNAT family N-acetyltransferase n=1 Tax=Zoogloea sp. TaxID=49181 RepID=UPI001416D585|nr:MAG: GNAT family N-acetyltransferase [Zoogloea sp.]
MVLQQFERVFSLPFMLGGRQVLAKKMSLAVREVSLAEALGGADGDILSLATVPAHCAGSLLCNIPDPGWRTHTVYDDRVACVLSRDTWHYLSLAGSFDGFMANRYSEKSRESFEREEIRLTARCGGTLALREYRDAAGGTADFLKAVERIRAVCAAPPPALPGKERRRPARDGRGYVLFAADEPVAYLRLGRLGDILWYAGAGERDDYRSVSAGTLLHLQVIRRLFQDGECRYLDFRPGDSEIKRQFANGALRSAVLLNLRPTLLNRAWLAAFAANRRAAAPRAGVGAAPGQLALRGALSGTG